MVRWMQLHRAPSRLTLCFVVLRVDTAAAPLHITQSTLRDALVYPATSSSLYDDAGPTDDQLRGLLRAVDLDHLLTREGGLDASVVWQDQLSVGEQQRIGFIRMLYHKCVLCVSVLLSLPLNPLTPMA